jgi:nucleoside-diphosphate-sugar epimerase
MAGWGRVGQMPSLAEILAVNDLATSMAVKAAALAGIPFIYPSTGAVHLLDGDRTKVQREDTLDLEPAVRQFVEDTAEVCIGFAAKRDIIGEDEAIQWMQEHLSHHELPEIQDRYALSKLIGETIAAQYRRSVILRLWHAYGPGDDTDRRIPTLVREFLDPSKAREPLSVLAEQIAFADIKIVIDALDRAAALELPFPFVINVAGRELLEMTALAQTLKHLTGSTRDIIHEAPSSDRIPIPPLVFGHNRADQFLHLPPPRPSYEVLLDTVRWFETGAHLDEGRFLPAGLETVHDPAAPAQAPAADTRKLLGWALIAGINAWVLAKAIAPWLESLHSADIPSIPGLALILWKAPAWNPLAVGAIVATAVFATLLILGVKIPEGNRLGGVEQTIITQRMSQRDRDFVKRFGAIRDLLRRQTTLWNQKLSAASMLHFGDARYGPFIGLIQDLTAFEMTIGHLVPPDNMQISFELMPPQRRELAGCESKFMRAVIFVRPDLLDDMSRLPLVLIAEIGHAVFDLGLNIMGYGRRTDTPSIAGPVNNKLSEVFEQIRAVRYGLWRLAREEALASLQSQRTGEKAFSDPVHERSVYVNMMVSSWMARSPSDPAWQELFFGLITWFLNLARTRLYGRLDIEGDLGRLQEMWKQSLMALAFAWDDGEWLRLKEKLVADLREVIRETERLCREAGQQSRIFVGPEVDMTPHIESAIRLAGFDAEADLQALEDAPDVQAMRQSNLYRLIDAQLGQGQADQAPASFDPLEASTRFVSAMIDHELQRIQFPEQVLDNFGRLLSQVRRELDPNNRTAQAIVQGLAHDLAAARAGLLPQSSGVQFRVNSGFDPTLMWKPFALACGAAWLGSWMDPQMTLVCMLTGLAIAWILRPRWFDFQTIDRFDSNTPNRRVSREAA